MAVLTAVITAATFLLRPVLFLNFFARPWGYVFPGLTIAGLLGVVWFLRRRAERAAFLSSCAYLLGMLTSVAFSLYPRLLPSSLNPQYALTIENSKVGAHGLRVGVAWWLVGVALATAYSIYTYRNFSGKVELPEP